MATFYDYFNEQKYADAVKNVSNAYEYSENPAVLLRILQYLLMVNQEACTGKKKNPNNSNVQETHIKLCACQQQNLFGSSSV